MCDPVTIAVVSAVGSAAIGGTSAAMSADAQQQAANYNAQVAANNAIISQQQRSAALEQGQAQAQQQQLQQSQLAGQQRAALAANGVDLNSGSAVDIAASTKFLGAADVNAIQANAARAAWGYQVQGMNDTAQSGLDKWQANNINPAGIGAMAGVGSLLGSASQYGMAKSAAGGVKAPEAG